TKIEERKISGRLKSQRRRKQRIATSHELLAEVNVAREEREGETPKNEDDRKEASTHLEIIAALKKHRLALAMTFQRLSMNNEKHKIGSFTVQAIGLLLSEMRNLLERLEDQLRQ